MNKIHLIIAGFLFSLSVAAPVSIVQADSDYNEARHLLNAGEILPLETILGKLRQTHPGRVLEVELEKQGGRIIYEVEILSKTGVVSEIYIDAKTGKILSSKRED